MDLDIAQKLIAKLQVELKSRENVIMRLGSQVRILQAVNKNLIAENDDLHRKLEKLELSDDGLES